MVMIPLYYLRLSFIVLVLSIAAAVVNGEAAVEFGSQQREFDYFALSLQWPGTFCRKTGHCCTKNACCRGSGAPTHFTIHGLWPDYNDGTWPACCTHTEFNENEISTLLKPLQEYWPSLSCGSPSTCRGKKGSFWQHEWEKHGTCSSPVTGDEYNYFLTTLNVYFKYNVTSVLHEAGYVASNREKYPLGGIISAVQNAFHATPQVVCSKGAVEELRLCFYKDFKPRDCVTSKDISPRNTCPKYVSLPTNDPIGLSSDGDIPWISEDESI